MSSSTLNGDTTVTDALCLIDQGWENLQPSPGSPSPTSPIFVLGGTGSGKSTQTLIATGNLQNLISTPGQDGTGLVIIDQVANPGQGRIGDPQVASRTFLPEYLSCTDDPSLIFVDCPGFNDNRGTHMDIAAMVLIKKISEQVDSARFLFVVPYSSVSYSNRNDFLDMCAHATGFFTNLDKMKHSIGLVITKVDNRNPATGDQIEDQAVINVTSRFLNECLRHTATSPNFKRFIGYLLDDQSKWALVRYPSQPGPLSTMDHFVEARQKIRDICRNKLTSVPVNSEDFAVTLSSESKYIIASRLIPHMRGKIDHIFEALVTEMGTEFFADFKEEIEKKRVDKLVDRVKNLEQICDKLKRVGQRKSRNGVLPPVTYKVTKISGWTTVNLPEVRMEELKKMEEQLHLFQQVTLESSHEGSSVKIIDAINCLRSDLEDLHKKTLKRIKDKSLIDMESLITERANKMVTKFSKNYKEAFWSSLETRDKYGRQILERLQTDWGKLKKLENEGIPEGEKLSGTLKRLGKAMETELDRDSIKKLKEIEKDLEMLLELTDMSPRSSEGSGILPEIRKRFQDLRKEARGKVRKEFIKLVHGEVKEVTDSLFEHLETTFFDGTFYSDLSMETLESKRKTLTTVRKKLQKLWANLEDDFEGVLQQVFKIFQEEIPEEERIRIGELEALLDFYDHFLGNPVPRPRLDWMEGMRSLEKRVEEMEKLYEFLELAMDTNPGSIDGDLVAPSVERTVSRFLKALRATTDIRRIVEERGTEEDKNLIRSIAGYLEDERRKLEEKERSRSASSGSSSSSCCHHDRQDESVASGGSSSSSGPRSPSPPPRRQPGPFTPIYFPGAGGGCFPPRPIQLPRPFPSSRLPLPWPFDDLLKF